MKKEERIVALKALAVKHLFVEHCVWQNPLNPRSIGIRWIRETFDMFKQF